MSPMLRGEALPLPDKEVEELRAALDRNYGDRVIDTVGGPWLMVRVPRRHPDFLRDAEEAAEIVPYRDLRGFRGVILIGDAAIMGVATETFRAILEERERSERDWLAKLRVTLPPWGYDLGRPRQDPRRRLRFVFRIDVESVEDVAEKAFDELAKKLDAIKKASPGMARPDQVFLVAHTDHVRIEGNRFFTELEARRKVIAERAARELTRRLEERRKTALEGLERLSGRPHVDVPTPRPMAPTTAATIAPTDPRPHGRGDDVLRELRERFHPAAASPAPVARTSPEPAKPSPPLVPASPHFAFADRHPDTVSALRATLECSGYRLKERLLVRGVPVVLAAVRDEGYPMRVLIHMCDRLDAEGARALLKTGRGVGSDLLLAVADTVTAEAERVALATNLKTMTRDAVPTLRFD